LDYNLPVPGRATESWCAKLDEGALLKFDIVPVLRKLISPPSSAARHALSLLIWCCLDHRLMIDDPAAVLGSRGITLIMVYGWFLSLHAARCGAG
jgi:hypothetical protein